MAAGTQRRIDQDRTGPVGLMTGQRRGEQFDTAIEEDGHVAEIVCHRDPSPVRPAPLHRGPCPSSRT